MFRSFPSWILLASVFLISIQYFHVFSTFVSSVPPLTSNETHASGVHLSFLYFLVTSAVTWVFGDSLILLRWLTPFVLLATVLIAYFAFRRHSIAAFGLFASCTWFTAHTADWPVVRPDIMMTLFVALGLLYGKKAIESQRPVCWAYASFFIGCAGLSIPFAWPLLAGAFAIWCLDVVRRHQESQEPAAERRRSIGTFIAFSIGMALGGLLFFIVLSQNAAPPAATSLTAMGGLTESGSALFFHRLVKIFGITGTGNIGGLALGAFLTIGLLLACVSLLAGPKLKISDRSLTASTVMPPFVLWLASLAMIALNPMVPTGYGSASQITAVWTSCALMSVIIAKTRGSATAGRKLADPLAVLAVTGLVLALASWSGTRSDEWQYAAEHSTDFSTFVLRVVEPIPVNARVWGNPIFGTEAGTLLKPVATLEAIRHYKSMDEVRKKEAVPDFIILDQSDNYGLSHGLAALKGIGTNPSTPSMLTATISQLFPLHRLDLINLVSAPPYGTARVYRLTEDDSGTQTPPTVQMNDGRSENWFPARFSAMPLPKILASEAVSLMTSATGIPVEIRAKLSKSFVLPAGKYMISIKRDGDRARTGNGAFVITTTSRYYVSNRNAEAASNVSPYFSSEERIYALHSHPGGPLYVNHYTNAQNPSFQVADILLLELIQTPTKASDSFPMPAPKLWTSANGVSLVSTTNSEAIKVNGNARTGEIQITSPEFVVPGKSTIRIKLPIDVIEGALAVGVLSQSESWRVRPAGHLREITFKTDKEERVRLVVLNGSIVDDAYAARFIVNPAMISVTPEPDQTLYVDRLSQCRSNRTVQSEHCR